MDQFILDGVRYIEIPGYPRYYASEDGHIWSMRQTKWKRLRPAVTRRDHIVVGLCSGKKNSKRQFYVHRLILLAFAGPCPPGMECRHLDDDPFNNRLENLRWGTRLENAADKNRNGRQTRGEDVKCSKLKEEDVREIRREIASGKSVYRIAKEHGVNDSSIHRIRRGEGWRHVV